MPIMPKPFIREIQRLIGKHLTPLLVTQTQYPYAGAGGRDQDERPHHPGADGPWLIQRHRPSVLTVSSPFSRALRTR